MTAALAEKVYKAMKESKTPVTKATKTLPILSHARIYTHEGQITIQAIDTSGDGWEMVTATAAARVENEFDTCVPMKSFRDWMSVTAKYKTVIEFTFDPKIQILTVKERAEVSSRAQFKCIDSAEFPSNIKPKSA